MEELVREVKGCGGEDDCGCGSGDGGGIGGGGCCEDSGDCFRELVPCFLTQTIGYTMLNSNL